MHTILIPLTVVLWAVATVVVTVLFLGLVAAYWAIIGAAALGRPVARTLRAMGRRLSGRSVAASAV